MTATPPEHRDSDGGLGLIAIERARQVTVEGWTSQHDDVVQSDGELAQAASCYASTAAIQTQRDVKELPPCFIHKDWPWAREWWKPSNDPIRNLVKAGALIVAEIDRILRSRGIKVDSLLPFDFRAHLRRQREFSDRTFGPGLRPQGVIDHIRKELVEIEAKPDDLEEWIDVVILALDGAGRSGATPEQIVEMLVAKQTKNEGRRWPDWRTADPNKAITHTKKGSEQ